MRICYDSDTDLLHVRFDPAPQPVTNVALTDHIVLDLGADEKIVGLEILDASEVINLAHFLPIETEQRVARAV